MKKKKENKNVSAKKYSLVAFHCGLEEKDVKEMSSRNDSGTGHQHNVLSENQRCLKPQVPPTRTNGYSMTTVRAKRFLRILPITSNLQTPIIFPDTQHCLSHWQF